MSRHTPSRSGALAKEITRPSCANSWPMQVPWPAVWEEQGKAVGVSLSLFESLILPLSCFRAVVLQYAAQAYAPGIHWMEVSSQDLLLHEQAA